MKPVIGIIPSYIYENGTYSYRVSENHVNAIRDHGGLPLVLPYSDSQTTLKQTLSLLHGLYFIGGCDILPVYYGEEPLPGLGELCPNRDEFEIQLYQAAVTLDLPMFGVCRGMQIMNVAAGGTLYQDLASQQAQLINHNPIGLERSLSIHRIKIAQNSRLFSILETSEIMTNSSHHEAVKALGSGYRITARTSDQVVEAFESTKLTFSLGVQWHPEDMYQREASFSKLYQAFITAAAKYQAN
jgi:putative glutamine amidotransferase